MQSEDFSTQSNDNLQNNGVQASSLTIPVVEEFVTIGKQTIEKDAVVVSKKVDETTEAIDMTLLSEEYNVEHVPLNEYVDEEAPKTRYEGDTLIIPVLREVIVKRLLLVEEIKITKKTTETHEQQQVSLRKETVTVTRRSSNDVL